jgi:predicted nuclease with TOPRIM domain
MWMMFLGFLPKAGAFLARYWKLIAITLAVLYLGHRVYSAGYESAKAECIEQQEELRLEAEKEKAELRAEMKQEAKRAEKQTNKLNERTDKIVEKYEDAAKQKPWSPSDCSISADEQRLLNELAEESRRLARPD